MSSLMIMLPVALVLPLLGEPAFAQELRHYKHPALDMQFSASQGWLHQSRPGDEGTHELVDPVTGLHVLMWYTSTEQSAKSYLMKMASMMDLRPGARPAPRTINDLDSWVLATSGRVKGRHVKMLLAVIPSGRSRLHPFEKNIYIVQIWSPITDDPGIADRMDQLLESVRITDIASLQGCPIRLYPETTESPPDLPSPYVAEDGEVYVTVRTKANRYALVPVRVENGAPNDYARGEWDKGRQLAVDADDFPSLARTGLHSEEELGHVVTITGRPITAITADARPGQASVAGFVAADEDLLAVLLGDNRSVASLGMTHPELARPLFEIVNLILRDLELYRRGRLPVYNIASVLYNKLEIQIEASASKGWQESIFDDEVQGYWSIRIWRKPTYGEQQYLRHHYGNLGQDKLEQLTEMLTSIHTSEMVPFYITRYGFYEGHTDHRADPISITNLFRLMSIEEIDGAMGGDLYRALIRHY